jgi:uncharacterized membrane protein SirB2
MSPETYVLLRHAHRTFATLSILGFTARWLGVMAMQPWTQQRVAKTLPHVIDTLLLLSALAMAWGAGFTPENAPWMTAKIVLLLVYIGLGVVALRPTQPRRRRAIAGVAGILVFAHIVTIALTKQPLGYFARLV